MTSVPDDRCRKAAGGLPWRSRRNRPLRPKTPGKGLLTRFDSGARVRHVPGAAVRSFCPVVGRTGPATLIAAIAPQGRAAAARRAAPRAGIAFVISGVAPGQAEHRGIL